jgi:hypothetical protein
VIKKKYVEVLSEIYSRESDLSRIGERGSTARNSTARKILECLVFEKNRLIEIINI